MKRPFVRTSVPLSPWVLAAAATLVVGGACPALVLAQATADDDAESPADADAADRVGDPDDLAGPGGDDDELDVVEDQGEEEGEGEDAADGDAPGGEDAGVPVPAGAAAAESPARSVSPPPAASSEAVGANDLAVPTVVGDDEPAEPDADAAGAEAAGDTAAEAEEAPAAAPPGAGKPVTHRWRNSFFTWSNNLDLGTLAPGLNQTFNPTYSWGFSLQPRWYLGPSLFLRVNQTASIEWTDTDFRARNREFVLNDTSIDILEGNLASVGGVTFSAGGRVILPTSIASQNATMIIGGGGFGLARYTVPNVLKGLILIGSAGYTYRHFDQNVPSLDLDEDEPPVNAGVNTVGREGTLPNSAHSFGVGISGVLVATGKLFVNTSFSWTRGWGIPLAGGCVPADDFDTVDTRNPEGGCNGLAVPASNDDRNRDRTFFSLGASYQFNKWLNVGLSAGTSTLFNIDGFDDRNPIFNRGTTLTLSTQITLDQLYNDLAGGDESRVALPGQPF